MLRMGIGLGLLGMGSVIPGCCKKNPKGVEWSLLFN